MGELVEGDILPIDIALTFIRDERNILLNKSDFYLMPDYPITEIKKDQWKIYRQSLRDLTANINKDNLILIQSNGELNVGGFTWPTPP